MTTTSHQDIIHQFPCCYYSSQFPALLEQILLSRTFVAACLSRRPLRQQKFLSKHLVTVAPLHYPDDLRSAAYRIHDYIQISGQAYPKEAPDAQELVSAIVNHSFRQAKPHHPPTSRTTARSQSVEPPPYPLAWAVERGRLIKDIKTFVAAYNTWKEADKPAELRSLF